MNYATELARISVQPQNYSDENWDEAMALCDKADAEITALNAEVKYTRDIMLRYRDRIAKDEKLRAAYNDQIRIIEEQADIIGGVQELVYKWGGIDGSHHKQWLIDEIIKLIAGDNYESWVKAYNNGECGDSTYEWDEGIAP